MRRALGWLAVVACAHAAPHVAVPPPDPGAALVDQLNLGFEATDGTKPTGWVTIAASDLALDATHTHGGKQSVRLVSAGTFQVISAMIPIELARGKHVAISGWLRSDGLKDGYGAVWVRADQGKEIAELDNLNGKGAIGTSDWKEFTAEVDVPADATGVPFGVFITAAGTLWADDLRVKISEPGQPATISGRVTDGAGKPVAGAMIAIVAANAARPAVVVTSGAAGDFSASVPAGHYGITATSDRGAVYVPSSRFAGGHPAVTVVLASGVPVKGSVIATDPLPANVAVLARRESEDDSDLFMVHVDPATGAFAATLPAATYVLQVQGSGVMGEPKEIALGQDPPALSLKASLLGPPPADVVAWIKNHAIPLKTVVAGSGFDDLAPLGEAIGDARIVGLGEATHGTREFFQMKHRLLEYLVAKLGFTVFAIEANLPEAYAVNDYVLNGTGNPAKALAGLYFWTWNTEEVLDMIKWMRAWNADPAHVQKVKFYGFDMQTTIVAAKAVIAAIGAGDPAAAQLAPLADADSKAYTRLSPDDRQKLHATLADVEKRLAADKKQSAIVVEDVRVLEQAADMLDVDFSRGSDVRDAAMSANIGWILDQEPKGTRMVVWAHNGHVETQDLDVYPMGKHLKETYGAAYMNIGFVFGQGSFQAMDFTKHKLTEWTVGPAPESDVSTAFARAGVGDVAALDLRHLPPGKVADWLNNPHPMRETGAGFADEDSMEQLVTLPKRFDAVIYVAKTTRARPVVP